MILDFKQLPQEEQDKYIQQYFADLDVMKKQHKEILDQTLPNYNIETIFSMFHYNIYLTLKLMDMYMPQFNESIDSMVLGTMYSQVASEMLAAIGRVLIQSRYEKAQVPDVDELKRIMEL